MRVHGTTRARPIDPFPEEAAALGPLKTVAAAPIPVSRRFASDCFVDLDTNRYSVPHLFCDGPEIARQFEQRGRFKTSLVPAHVQGLYPRLLPADAVPTAEEVPAPDLARHEQLAGGAA